MVGTIRDNYNANNADNLSTVDPPSAQQRIGVRENKFRNLDLRGKKSLRYQRRKKRSKLFLVGTKVIEKFSGSIA